jgi:hypothetical protein
VRIGENDAVDRDGRWLKVSLRLIVQLIIWMTGRIKDFGLGRVGGTDDETGIRERCKFREDIT